MKKKPFCPAPSLHYALAAHSLRLTFLLYKPNKIFTIFVLLQFVFRYSQDGRILRDFYSKI
jgi:hypothetical protein